MISNCLLICCRDDAAVASLLLQLPVDYYSLLSISSRMSLLSRLDELAHKPPHKGSQKPIKLLPTAMVVPSVGIRRLGRGFLGTRDIPSSGMRL